MHHLESLIQSIPFNLFGANPGAYPLISPTGDPSSPHASFASATHAYPMGVPPPSLSLFPLINPSTHFPSSSSSLSTTLNAQAPATQTTDDPSRFSAAVSPSYLYLDDEGYTRWQGETSGLPLLDFLVERELPTPTAARQQEFNRDNVSTGEWFPDRQQRRINVNPESIWKLITSVIMPELMDRCARFILYCAHFLIKFAVLSNASYQPPTISCHSCTCRRS